MRIVSKLVAVKLLGTITLHMRNFIANFVRILGICKDFTGNSVNELGNVLRCGVVPKFSDLEVIALGITEVSNFRDMLYVLWMKRGEILPEQRWRLAGYGPYG